MATEPTDEKGRGRGKGAFTRAGVQADQEARITAIEDFLEAEFGADLEGETPSEG